MLLVKLALQRFTRSFLALQAPYRCTVWPPPPNHSPWLTPLTLWVRTLFRRGVLPTTLCNKVCQWPATGRWFSPPIKLTAQCNWNIVESGVKHHNPNPQNDIMLHQRLLLSQKYSDIMLFYVMFLKSFILPCWFNNLYIIRNIIWTNRPLK